MTVACVAGVLLVVKMLLLEGVVLAIYRASVSYCEARPWAYLLSTCHCDVPLGPLPILFNYYCGFELVIEQHIGFLFFNLRLRGFEN